MDNLDKKLLDYIENKTQSPLETQIAFFDENVDKHPKMMIDLVRGLSEATVEYLYFFVSNSDKVPGPYWCLVWKGNNYDSFVKMCEINKKRRRVYPDNYQKMWEANQLLKKSIPNTFIEEADRIRYLGNLVVHNNPILAQLDLPREAKKSLDSYIYLLSEVNRVVSSKHTEPGGRTVIDIKTGTEVKTGAEVRTGTGRDNTEIGNKDHYSEDQISAEKDSSTSFDVKKWFAGLQAELAKERAKTQEDYDLEDDKDY